MVIFLVLAGALLAVLHRPGGADVHETRMRTMAFRP
jgi:hypothetical protein